MLSNNTLNPITDEAERDDPAYALRDVSRPGITIVRDGGVWIARRDDDKGLFAADLLDLAQMLKQVGWV